MLGFRTSLYASEGKSISVFKLINKVVELKKEEETKWLKEVNSQALQWSLRNLDAAFTKFFREKKGYPNFKKKSNGQSFGNPQGTTVDFELNRVYIPKFKEGIKAVLHREFEGKIKTSVVSKTPSGKYFISILVEEDVELPKATEPIKDKTIGIDLGIAHFLIDSNGNKIANPKYLNKNLKKLAKEQRRLVKKVKGSNRYKRQRVKVARVYEKISNCRRDFLHKVTYQLVNNQNYDSIAVETLSVTDMLQDEETDRNNNRNISDASWGMFGEFLKYKCEWYGKNLLQIGQFLPSSKTCSKCGWINRGLKRSDRVWTCQCGVKHDRDVNAAINIKNFAFCTHDTYSVGRDTPEVKPVELKKFLSDEAGSPRIYSGE
jgi:putative transposase